jgi:hypothetical protein
MGESAAVTPAEETPAADDAGRVDDGETRIDQEEAAITRADTEGDAPRPGAADPWQGLVQVGSQLLAALASAHDPDAPAHPWIARDPVNGERSLKIPLPPPETARQLAMTLSAIADSLRGGPPR